MSLSCPFIVATSLFIRFISFCEFNVQLVPGHLLSPSTTRLLICRSTDPNDVLGFVTLTCSKRMKLVTYFSGNLLFFIMCSFAAWDSLWYFKDLHRHVLSSSVNSGCAWKISKNYVNIAQNRSKPRI
ncbi:hypothetical protein IC575_003248 [Cucumis melo]